MSDPGLGLQRQKSAEQQIQFTREKETEISALQRKLGLAPEDTMQEQRMDALQEVRTRVAENMPITLTDKILQWQMNNEGTVIRKAKSAKNLVSPERMAVRNHLQIFRTALMAPISSNKRERELEAKHIKDGLEKMREACEEYRKNNPDDPETPQEAETLNLIQKVEAEILDQEKALNDGIDALVESKEEITGTWINTLAGNGVEI